MTGNPPDVDSFPGLESDERPIPDGHEFVLLLTHDVDRPYKTYQSAYYALTDPERRRHHLASLLPGSDPYWQFDAVMALEEELGVRSAFYFLSEQGLLERPAREWLTKKAWQLYAGRYSMTDPSIRRVVADLDDGGWEVGFHGSYESPADPDRLRSELSVLEDVLGDTALGGRQHYLNLEIPDTWHHYQSLGLKYDASLGSSEQVGFHHGYGLKRPFDDEFVVFPLTIMENALPDPCNEFDDAWQVCESLLREAVANDAVMSVLWHPRHFSEADFPGYQQLYRKLVTMALEMGAWVGSPGQFYEQADLGTLERSETIRQ